MKAFDPEDPMWTAYILNELSEEQKEALEQDFQQHPELKAYAEELQEAASMLRASFESEPDLALEELQRENVMGHLPKKRRKKKKNTNTYPLSIAIAATVVLLLTFGWMIPSINSSLMPMEHSEPYVRLAADGQEGKPRLEPRSLSMPEPELLEMEQPLWMDDSLDYTFTPVNQDGDGLMSDLSVVSHSDSSGIKRPFNPLGTSGFGSGVGGGYGSGMGGGMGGVPYDPQEEALSMLPESRNEFDSIEGNPFRSVGEHPLSTFSIDVDTASYSVVRSFLNRGDRPPPEAVRIEEMINYFQYAYAAPDNGAAFAAHMAVATTPWAPEHALVRIALKGREIPKTERPPLNLVYLLDVSGSMDQRNKLPLVKRSMALLAEQLHAQDRLAIVVYAGAAGMVLPPTSGANTREIMDALAKLNAGGSTAGGAGIQLAYQVARESFAKDGVNRVILCTDGDFNVGISKREDLEKLIEQEAKSGIQLSVLGFGMGNYKDSNLEGLSNKGNGNYGYIDSYQEARKLFVEQMLGTLVTIAKDVKIQVEFNPALVAGYRLVGYENRILKKEDFNNDQVDAGDIGAGHTVTALYEVVPVGLEVPGLVPKVDPLKYQKTPAAPETVPSAEWLTLKLRHKQPGGAVSSKLEFPLEIREVPGVSADLDFRFASAVAAFGFWLRDPAFQEQMSLEEILALAKDARGEDEEGYRAELIRLIRTLQDKPEAP